MNLVVMHNSFNQGLEDINKVNLFDRIRVNFNLQIFK